MRISDWSSDVCSSDLGADLEVAGPGDVGGHQQGRTERQGDVGDAVQHRATQSHLLAAEFAEGYRGDELATEDAAAMAEDLAGVAVAFESGVGVFCGASLLGSGGEAQDSPSCSTRVCGCGYKHGAHSLSLIAG